MTREVLATWIMVVVIAGEPTMNVVNSREHGLISQDQGKKTATTEITRNAVLEGFLAAHWETLKRRLEDLARDPDPSRLYDVQLDTMLLLERAIEQKGTSLVEDILYIYAIPLTALEERREVSYWEGRVLNKNKYVPAPARRTFHAWYLPHTGRQEEPVLAISQFLYAVARGLSGLERRSPVLEMYGPVLRDHYTRWILGIESDETKGTFQREAWGCGTGRFQHRVIVLMLRNKAFAPRPSHCNAVTDFDLWIITGAIEFLALNEKFPKEIGLEATDRDRIREYVRLGAELIHARSLDTSVLVSGVIERGLLFDPGVWKDHPEMKYSGVTTDSFPMPWSVVGTSISPNIAMDVSHGRRLVQVFETLYRHREITNLTFPSDSDMRALTNQLAFAVFEGDYTYPRFKNFIDGSNGWYRVGYAGRSGFGYPPFGLSNEWISGGYCRLERYQPELRRLCTSILDLMRSSDPDRVTHREKRLAKCGYHEFVEQQCPSLDVSARNYYVLNFLSSLLD